MTKLLLILAVLISGCTIEGVTPTVIKIELDDAAIKELRKAPIQIEQVYTPKVATMSVDEQYEILKLIHALNPNLTDEVFINAFETISRVKYYAVIERNQGPKGGPIHPRLVGELTGDRIVGPDDFKRLEEIYNTETDDSDPEEIPRPRDRRDEVEQH